MPALVTRPAVPICKVGTWHTMLGDWECTAEQLADAVTAQRHPAFRSPVLKLGHNDPRFTDGEILGDGEPAVGRLENLRLTEDGLTLLADLVGVPAWLDEIMASAYPSRSIEAMTDVVAPDGTEFAMVVTGLALLGVTRPAIESLGDIADLYGTSSDVTDWVAARHIAASALPPSEGPPMPGSATTGSGTIQHRKLGHVVIASASIEELTTAFEKWAETVPVLGRDAWVRDLYTDKLVATVWADDSAQFWQVPWSETDGVFTFGDPVQVKPSYEPVQASTTNSGVRLLSETPMPVRSGRGREEVTEPLPEETRVPLSPAIAERLGVPADADDETVLAAVDKVAAPPVPPPAATTEPSGDESEDGQPADVQALVDAAVAKATAPILDRLGVVSEELAAEKAAKAADTKASVITAAVRDGKIKPADRSQWEADYDAAPEVVTAMLGRLAKGTAVPVSASGHAGNPADTATPLYDALYAVGSDA